MTFLYDWFESSIIRILHVFTLAIRHNPHKYVNGAYVPNGGYISWCIGTGKHMTAGWWPKVSA